MYFKIHSTTSHFQNNCRIMYSFVTERRKQLIYHRLLPIKMSDKKQKCCIKWMWTREQCELKVVNWILSDPVTSIRSGLTCLIRKWFRNDFKNNFGFRVGFNSISEILKWITINCYHKSTMNP